MRAPGRILPAILRVVLGIGIVWGLCLLKDRMWFRLYPLVVSGTMLTVFAVSLFRTPLVEIFAHRMGEKLDADGLRYCRRVTVVWVVFLALHTGVTLWTVFADRSVWALYNGCIAYLLMGAMFAGEFIFRMWVKRGRNG